MYIKVKDFLSRVKKIVEQQLVEFANYPASRIPLKLRPIDKDFPLCPLLDSCETEEYNSSLREIMTYKYILEALNGHLIPLSKELLYVCITNMRKAGYVDEDYLNPYHRFACAYYRKKGLTHKAEAHERAELLYNMIFDLLIEDSFDFNKYTRQLRQSPERLKTFILYVLSEGCRILETDSKKFHRDQFLLLEGALKLGVSTFAEDESCDPLLRACIYYYESHYYGITNRPELAERARKAYVDLCGERDYVAVCKQLMEQLPAIYFTEQLFVDTLFDFDTIYGDPEE